MAVRKSSAVWGFVVGNLVGAAAVLAAVNQFYEPAVPANLASVEGALAILAPLSKQGYETSIDFFLDGDIVVTLKTKDGSKLLAQGRSLPSVMKALANQSGTVADVLKEYR